MKIKVDDADNISNLSSYVTSLNYSGVSYEGIRYTIEEDIKEM